MTNTISVALHSFQLLIKWCVAFSSKQWGKQSKQRLVKKCESFPNETCFSQEFVDQTKSKGCINIQHNIQVARKDTLTGCLCCCVSPGCVNRLLFTNRLIINIWKLDICIMAVFYVNLFWRLIGSYLSKSTLHSSNFDWPQ